MDLIIGAGVSGISYANFTNNEYCIIEADSEIGGYCKTIKRNGYVWDYSGHFFHFTDDEIKDLVCRNIKKSDLRKVEKQTQIFYKGNLIDFPFQKNIHQLPKEEFIECLYSLYDKHQDLEIKSFKDMVFANFGESISEKFLIPYNEKLYACNLDYLDKDAMGRFFPKANIEEIVRNFKQTDNNSYNQVFTYPIGGAIEYVNSLFENLESPDLLLNEELLEIDIKHHIIKTTKRELEYDNLISTIPFSHLLNKCKIEYNKDIYSSNKVLVFNIGFDTKGTDLKNHWIYFPSKEYVFYRVGFYDNILNMDKMSLYVEIGYNSKQSIDDVETVFRQVLVDLARVGIVSTQRVVDYHYVIMDPAYIHINQEQIKNVKYLKNELSKHNIYSIGRYGSWTYCSIEDNIKEAKELAKLLLKK